MKDTSTDRVEAKVQRRSESENVVRKVLHLGSPWPVIDPFLVIGHLVDHYPAANQDLGPATSEGRQDADDWSSPGWRMYYGNVVPGFPRHPHRGMETVTFTRRGVIDHSDSLGATARYGGGDVQWMTAGRGIEHAEMFPLRDQSGPNTLDFFQIWVNLPSDDKMVEPYFTMFWREDLPSRVPRDDAGRTTEVTVVAGAFEDVQPLSPPPDSWAARSEAELAIWQFLAEPLSRWTLPSTAQDETLRTLYVFDGSVEIDGKILQAPIGAVLRSDTPVAVSAGPDGVQAIILQGRPIGEPVVRGGGFAMNTPQEIAQAYRDYDNNGFGEWRWPNPDPAHPRSTHRFAHHPDGRTEYPEGDDR